MIQKVIGEQSFQVLADNFTIGPASASYVLQISADGKNFSDLFAVAADTTRLVTNVANGSFYKLKNNEGEVSINWRTQCGGGESGGGGVAGVSSVNGKTGAVNLANINGFDLTNESAIGVYTGVWSGDKHYLAKENGQQGGMFLATINGQSIITDKDTPLDIQVEGGSGDYTVVDTLPEATKEGQMVYLTEDMTHQQPVTGVGGKSMEFGETGENEYHIIQYGDADLRIYRDGDGNIIRVWSRGQDLPFSLNGTWYKLSKSFTGHKDAFYRFNGGWFWFYVYEGEEFATNDFGGGTYAAGEPCDYVDTIIDYEKGQYIVKDIDGTLSWEKYDFPAKVFVYDGKADHSDIANAVKPYFEALRAGGADAVNQMPHIYTIIYNGVPFSGFRSEGDDDHLVLYSSVMVEWASSIGTHKLYVWENGDCEWQDTGMHIQNPVYVSKEGFEGFNNATKITFKFNDGFEWGNVLAGKVYIDSYERDLYIRPANYGEEHRIDVSVQDWFGRDSICDPNYDQGDNGKLIKYETNGYSIYWVAYANLEARTMTIYMKSSHTEDFGFTPDEGLQGQINANHIEVSVEGGASVATVPTELSYKTGEGDKKVVFPTGGSKPTFYLSGNEEWTALVNDDQLQGLINYIKTNGLNSAKGVDVKVLYDEGRTTYSLNELSVDADGFYLTFNYGQNLVEISVDYDGNTISFEDKSVVTSDNSIGKIIGLTQEEYDALGEKEYNTLYVIKG